MNKDTPRSKFGRLHFLLILCESLINFNNIVLKSFLFLFLQTLSQFLFKTLCTSFRLMKSCDFHWVYRMRSLILGYHGICNRWSKAFIAASHICHEKLKTKPSKSVRGNITEFFEDKNSVPESSDMIRFNHFIMTFSDSSWSISPCHH